MKVRVESVSSLLEKAWSKRLTRTSCVRVFHGPGEGEGSLKNLLIDRFEDHYWVTQKGEADLSAVSDFLKSKGAKAAVLQERERPVSPEQSSAPEACRILFGNPSSAFLAEENGLKFVMKFTGVRHPGLFLDHEPLRRWLARNARFGSLLNTFCYTGSLSIAAKAGGTSHVTNLDLSRPSIEWSRENWRANGFEDGELDAIYGDVFEWLPRFKKKGRAFDCVIMDPPSSSRGPSGHFSTKKNLSELLFLGRDLLNAGGTLICSINSQNISWKEFDSVVAGSLRDFKPVQKLALPESFPTDPAEPEQQYLKGYILKRR